MVKKYKRWRYLKLKREINHTEYMMLERADNPIEKAKELDVLDNAFMKRLVKSLIGYFIFFLFVVLYL